jgi:hypothetical protein
MQMATSEHNSNGLLLQAAQMSTSESNSIGLQ